MSFLLSCGIMLQGLLAAASPSAVPTGVNLAAMADWDIVLAEDASPSEVYAAEEFRDLFAQAAGIRLPLVVTAAAQLERPDRHVYIGSSPALQSSRIGFDVDGFGPEDLRIIIRDANIAIAGGRPRGTLYGVYTFAEDYLGVRFLTHDHTHVPPLVGWAVAGPVDRFYHPPLAMRWSYYGETSRNPAFAARLRVNTVSDEPRLGGKTGQALNNHSFGRQIPSDKYGGEHPEYFALVDGRRLSSGNDWHDSEPCLTHPDVLRIVTEAVLAELKANPTQENISVSQNDNDKYCRCPNCAAIDEREGTSMGSLLEFVNAVADVVAREYPGIQVGTLSYLYSRQPPKTIRPRDNVQIQLCSIECCVIHPINDPTCEKNQAFCRDLAEWGKLTSNIFIWNYNTNFTNYLLPFPNLRVIEPNVRYFVASGTKGLFMQAAGNTTGAELSDLRNYMISNLLWDPNRSGHRLMDEFLDLHYGPAAGPIRRFIEQFHDHVERAGIHHNCFGGASPYGITEEVTQWAMAAFAEALELAGQEPYRSRVEKASICAYRAAIQPVWYTEAEAELSPELAERMRPLVARFFELCRKYGVTNAGENVTMDDLHKRLGHRGQ